MRRDFRRHVLHYLGIAERKIAHSFSSSALTHSHAISLRSAEGGLTMLTHSVDTSLLIFQGEQSVTQL